MTAGRVRALSAVCALALAGASSAAAAGRSLPSAPNASEPSLATLEECVTSVVQMERSATFGGEMIALPGTVRMTMRVDVQEALAGEISYHAIVAPGLGVWRESDAKVKIFKYLKQVTNLSSPARYRALVRFRWLGAHGHVIKRAEHLTPRCVQPAVLRAA
ncbi:MAG TPA: hypothetical protein VNZ05_09050 [Solirubrobacteraceae bacterium]|jgi:hypothetical protein|nr:hypothetical protein [Solirubrobacteraceae bacterium]